MRCIKWILLLCLAGGLYFGWSSSGGENPLPSYLQKAKSAVSFRTYVNSKLDRKNYVALSQVPVTFQQALIAVEDNRFHQHSGIDMEAVFRAVLVNLQSGELKEGGSTITQQLVKNLFLSQDRTWSRKALEIPLTWLMELQFSKSEILEMYVNTIYFGSGAYGINEAAQTYFGKAPRDLTLAEASLIAGLPAAPSVYSPLVNLEKARQRQRIVLAAMVKYSFITERQADEARNAPLRFDN
ncbi:MAG: transglycosylase domain-containing protein [Veillonellaceae bacterium]|nr:transglycosylase domain-containing protein [Veillonellaceae bacterium]